MGSITIRIPDELEEKIEAQRGEKSKSDFYRDIIAEHVNKPAYNLTTNESNSTGHIESSEQISMLKDWNTDLRSSNSQLRALLNQEQALHLQTQKLLPAPGQKKWWKFWE